MWVYTPHIVVEYDSNPYWLGLQLFLPDVSGFLWGSSFLQPLKAGSQDIANSAEIGLNTNSQSINQNVCKI